MDVHDKIKDAANEYCEAHEAWDKHPLINAFLEGHEPTAEDIKLMNEVTNRMNAAQEKLEALLEAGCKKNEEAEGGT